MKNIIQKHRFLYDFDYINSPRELNDLLLYQLGEIYCDNGSHLNEHIHDDFFEFSFITEGSGFFYAANIKTPVEKNDLFISLPQESHMIESDQKQPLRYYFLAFSFKEDSPYRKILYNAELMRMHPHYRKRNLPDLDLSFRNLLSVIESNAELSDVQLELTIKLFCVNIYQRVNLAETKQYRPISFDNEQNIYFQIVHYIDNNFAEMTKITDVCDVLHYNYIYLSRIFKNKFGSSLYTYYINKKLSRAKELLDEGNLSVTEISNALNYSSIYVFSRAFKRIYGVSPNAYRQQALEGKESE
ncbi:MAG: helix-turn-helix transcriptional regulator [Clostridia bacterium]|nr:helix-turn-helix transcriptional regulator [Clostridia bacterium]